FMKRLSAIILSLALLLACPGAVSAGSVFPDVADSAWYAGYVSTAAACGMVEGYPDGTFKPDKLLKYAEFIAMMTEQRTTDEAVSQIDTGHWGMPYYNMGLKLGYYSEGQVPVSKLGDPIPRRAMALIAAGYLMKNADVPASAPYREYTDVDSSDADEYYISLCSALGVLEGYDDGSFRPEKTLKRSEAVKVAVCCMELKQEASGASGQGGQPQTGDKPTVSELAPDMEIVGETPAGQYLVKNVEGLLDPERKAVLDQILASVKITKEDGRFYFSYSQPQIPEKWENQISCRIYNSAGAGISHYNNQKNVGLHPELWSDIRKAKSVKEELTGVGDTLEDKAISVKISLSDKSGETYYKDITYQLVKENDGSGDVFRIMAAYELEDYWQETENTHPGFWAWRNR
ncbi:MAG: S-layer homology domain-containing protein, partial [Firmicutes bacterium]|nr:S-layer homology domain-containing protein [Bacillota bacterium]